ncbi:hypothetical protein RHSIM_Rhsim06G0206700 [Rhododendron simsii]|uniref:MADS-box domain-containing protein n=1 Tax=Rhododendron simsii TaxID=118357 RepID=A0A834GRQ7_RHOSS|nr:hypothetical protein RHSIM_Rhsim06G0206700 [Rhododendron simsii]
MVTFSKRRQGLFKKSRELHCLTGAHVASVVFSPTGRPYVHGDPSFDATIDRYLNIINNTIYSTTSASTATGSSSTSCWMRVEDYWNVEELVVMKEKMGVIRGKVF